jgi:hypothetical protein
MNGPFFHDNVKMLLALIMIATVIGWLVYLMVSMR